MSRLRGYDPADGIQGLGDIWTVNKGAQRQRCALRRKVGDKLIEFALCKSQPEVFRTADDWLAEAVRRGWVRP
jgi:hypothetical protein